MFAALVCTIVSSSAIHILSGQGQNVLMFGLGMGVGMTWSCYVSIENWRMTMAALDGIAGSISAIALLIGPRYQFIHPKLALGLATPLTTATEFRLEIEVRGLLDAVALLGQTVVAADGVCGCCHFSNGHSANCAYVKAMQLHQEGCEKRVGWTQFKHRVKPP
ncbi:MAG: hypothetical protein DCF15_19280 [Phormidesmis priestleyi]|uniref:Uncharacterized protein n=1 Tax=Phormidesmis priestleyi TaxID=268141 RepID=A0A2W4YLA7_9CYAN|nr:MAG: hypothetical protein DCF15_19280 [Phormidesmis priestleyi]